MIKNAQKETIEAIIVGTLISGVGLLAEWLIENAVWRSAILGVSLLVALIVISAPHIIRVVSSFVRIASLSNFHDRASVMHSLMHDARDLCVRILGEAPEYKGHPKSADGQYLSNQLLYAHRSTVISLLEHMVRLFDSITPSDVKIFASIRDRREDDHYHTFARAGQYNPNRKHKSKPLHKSNSKTLSRLRDSFDSGSCVMITGSTKGPQMWEGQDNDQHGEDKSVLMGAVLSKSLSFESDKPYKSKMAFVIAICANKEDVFSEAHKPLMRACIDVFSMIANSVSRAELTEAARRLQEKQRSEQDGGGNGG